MDELTPGLSDALNCPLGKDNFPPDELAREKTVALDWQATASQVKGLQRLKDLAEIFVRLGSESQAGYRALTKSLIIGETVRLPLVSFRFRYSRGKTAVPSHTWSTRSARAPEILKPVRTIRTKSAGCASGDGHAGGEGRVCTEWE